MLVPGLGNLGAKRFTSRQPISSGATCSAGRQKKGLREVLGKRGGYGSDLGDRWRKRDISSNLEAPSYALAKSHIRKPYS